MDLIRSLMLDIEGIPSGQILSLEYNSRDTALALGMAGDVADKGDAKQLYHANLLAEAGFIKCDNRGYTYGEGEILIERLTWEGHEFLDSIKSDKVWDRVKARLASTIEDASLGIIKLVAEDVSKNILGL